MLRNSMRVLFVGAAIFCVPSITWAQLAPPLGTAAAFGALGNSGVTGAAGLGVVVTGEVGSSPTPTIINFPPSRTVPPFTVRTSNDGVVQQARIDAIAAYNNLVIQGPGAVIPDALGGQFLTSGIYQLGAADIASGTVLTLNGAGIFIFEVASTLTANVTSTVAGTANPCNIYWRVGTSATLNGVNFWGTVLADASITLGSNANLVGRALAGTGPTGAVTMAGPGGNTIGGCSVAGAGVPTLSQWAMIALSVLLALAGGIAMRRRQLQAGPHSGLR
jgi:hypothetical protein